MTSWDRLLFQVIWPSIKHRSPATAATHFLRKASSPLNIIAIANQSCCYGKYPIYKPLRALTPMLRVRSVERTLLTKATDTKRVKEDPGPSARMIHTQMKTALQAHSLMRKNAPEHMHERMATMRALMLKIVVEVWYPLYEGTVAENPAGLPRDEIIDFHKDISGPVSARILAHILGIPEARDVQMERWSQTSIDGAGNFGNLAGPFADSAKTNAEMNEVLATATNRLKATPDKSALSAMVNAYDPTAYRQIVSNIKIAVGGGIDEPRDALSTILFGLLTNRALLEAVQAEPKWGPHLKKGSAGARPLR